MYEILHYLTADAQDLYAAWLAALKDQTVLLVLNFRKNLAFLVGVGVF